MAQVNGQLTTCERCGEQVFRKSIGEGEADGGYTRWNKFEPYPDGWGYVSIPSEGERHESMMVCPACHALWDNVVNTYFLGKAKDEGA